MTAQGSSDASARKLFLIDAPGFVFRAYHALPPLTTASGTPTGAVLGFTNMLFRLLDDHRPDSIAAVFDAGKSHRKELYQQYKATRPPQPPELSVQFPLVQRVLEAFRVPVVQLEGYEADDVIATLTKRGLAAGLDVTIVSSDKDLMQLTSERVRLLDTMKDKVFGPDQVRDKFGVTPDVLGDWLALVGDTSDNIPGVAGVGPKTATKLLQQYGGLEQVLAAADEVAGKKLKENLKQHADLARLSRRLVALQQDCPLDMGLDELRAVEPDASKLRGLFGELEFGRLQQRLSPAPSIDTGSYRLVLDESALDGVVTEIERAPELALAVVRSNPRPTQGALVGLGLCWGAGQVCYVPVGHSYLGAPRQLSAQAVAARLGPVLEGDKPKHCHDHKTALTALQSAGVSLGGVTSDPMLASYLLDPSRASHRLEDLASDHLGHSMAVRWDGRTAPCGETPVEDALRLAGERAEITGRVGQKLLEALSGQEQLMQLYERIELPLCGLLAQLELRGCLVDVDKLRELSHELSAELAHLEGQIQREAGWEINVNSPKQLQRLLFDQLSLTTGRKTKTGFSTDADVLADLALEHPIAAQIEEYRTLSKLKSTYLDALPSLVDRRTGRVHTSFNQAVAATGRLSSSDPNLQNIPIRTPLGRRIRATFVAPEGRLLLSADYSQIELRVLAHLSHDPVLTDAFLQQQDVHQRTAAEVFGVAPQDVTDEQRRVAKAVNFGVIYGQTDWGLARQLRIPRPQARQYIEGYFARYAGVETFMKQTIEQARQSGEVHTLLGRRRPVHEIDSKRYQARTAAERIARNTPIQGTAADLIKLAMIRVEDAITAAGLDAPMILTVHDELVFEILPNETDAVVETVRQAMAAVANLDVPLKVDIGTGRTWSEIH